MAEVAHSRLGASSHYRWEACPGSVKASEGIPNESSVYAEEGTLAHDVAANYLLARPGWANGPGVTEEMVEAVQVYTDHVNSLRALLPSFEAVEQRLDLSEYHPALFGTADYVCYFDKEKTLHVVDYKHGAGIPVEVVGNTQLMYYGLGALHMNKFPVERIILTIVQPRCYHTDGPVRSWETDPITMLDFSFDLVDQAVRTEAPDAPLIAGDHCRFCPAQPTCPKPRELAMGLATAGFSDLSAVEPERLALYLEKIPQIKAWCEAVHQYAHAQAALGHVPPGWKLVDKRANRKWVEGTDVSMLEMALDMHGTSLIDVKIKSPAAVEKLLLKDKKFILDQFVVKESSGKTLVQTNDDRPAVKGRIESMFTEE